MQNATNLSHPTLQRKIRLAALRAYMSARSPKGCGVSKQNYIQNRHGRNIMRLDYHADKGFTLYGHESRNITDHLFSVLPIDVLA